MEQNEYTKKFTEIPQGRRPGTVPTDASRLKARASNPNKVTIVCPLGTFEGIMIASIALGLSPNLLSWYCSKGEQQRANGVKTTKIGNSYTDYRGWYKINKARKTSDGRKIHTALGDFNSIKEAADAHGITSGAICHKLKSEKQTDYYYLD